jgi:hypothetical protein
LLIVVVSLSSTKSAYSNGAEPALVLLFDKHCLDCLICKQSSDSRRRSGEASLSLLERRGETFIVKERWQATYGLSEGPKACLHDYRTPEGLYYTHYINRSHKDDATYGFISIATSYPNSEDLHDLEVLKGPLAEDKCLCSKDNFTRNLQYGICERSCDNTGSAISIHGGHSSPTAGCIRLLDPDSDPRDRSRIHTAAIAQLASILEQIPGARVPIISVRQAAPGCMSSPGQIVSHGCSDALLKVLDAPERLPRSRINEIMSNAAGLPNLRKTSPTTPLAPQVLTSPVLRELAIKSVWATSEATFCGPEQKQRCAATSLTRPTTQHAWCEGVRGRGEDQWLRFELSSRHRLNRVEIANGFWEQGAGSQDWYGHGRVAEVEISINGHTTLCSHPQEDPTQLDCDLDGTAGQQLMLRIKKAVPGESSEDTCISGVHFFAEEADAADAKLP